MNGLLSGINASEVQNDLLRARKEVPGRKLPKEFIDDCIKQNKSGFYNNKEEQTFSLLKPVKRLFVKDIEIIIQSDRSLFARLLVIQENRGVSIKKLLCHLLGPAACNLVQNTCRLFHLLAHTICLRHIFFIIDQYQKNSIKSCKRNRRANTGSTHLTPARLQQKLPKQMKIHLSIDTNKEELIDFLLNDWKTKKNYTGVLINR